MQCPASGGVNWVKHQYGGISCFLSLFLGCSSCECSILQHTVWSFVFTDNSVEEEQSSRGVALQVGYLMWSALQKAGSLQVSKARNRFCMNTV